jgi:hypothetical protein
VFRYLEAGLMAAGSSVISHCGYLIFCLGFLPVVILLSIVGDGLGMYNETYRTALCGG